MSEKPQDSQNPPPRPPGPPVGDAEEGPRLPLAGPFLLILVLGGILILYLYQKSPSNTGNRIKYSFFLQQLELGNVKEVKVFDEVLTGAWKSSPNDPDKEGAKLLEKFNTVLPPRQIEDRELIPLLKEKKVPFDVEEVGTGFGSQMLIWFLGPALLLFMFAFLMMRRTAGDPFQTGMMGNFIRSPAKRFRPSSHQTTFDDVAAMDNAKRELAEIVEFLKNPAKFQRLGATIPKGVLLMGPPGTGKTLLARAVAGEAGVPFFSINGSEFIQMFVGVGASRVRDLFRTAKDHAPCLIFIDEIDAVGRMRGTGLGGGHDEREQTLNQILSEMDGFNPGETVIVIAATNRPDVLDPALLRPGRFDRHVTIDRPNKVGRVGILKVHVRKVPLAADVDLDRVAAQSIGFSGADLRNLVNEAALLATREGKSAVTMEDFEQARDKVRMGPKREEQMNKHEREMTAYHEAGHALLAWLIPGIDPLHKVTIIPRGRALGVTQLLPDEDRYNIGEKRLHAQLTFIMGGRAAEKLIFDEYSAGAEDDLNKATSLARRMVSNWGMSEAIGPVAFTQSEDHPFLGKEIHEQRKFSEETTRIIDQEVQKFLTAAADRAHQTLAEHRADLESLAKALLEKESLGEEELKAILGHLPATKGSPAPAV
ncbi:MAG: ATP-dependent zinc metalloprotease FtsH [Planctomycetaceae bacterium]|nr:ATP-dependent zinc metalloprotease FtsH [Planctomycetaceae bacterium]